MRNFLTALIVPVLRVTGFRFSKRYRQEATRFHAAVYAAVDTVGANIRAGMRIEYPAPGLIAFVADKSQGSK